jgi:bifunctional ADP-heptose synthase (sugar kinase/adenylyltransferase)
MDSKILLIGETCTDRTLYCTHERNSPEDPSVPVYRIQEDIVSSGMVRIVASILDKLNTTYTLLTNITNEIVKTRLYVNGKQVARVDEDTKVNLEVFSVDWLRKNIAFYDVVVVSDYGKGLLNTEVIDILNKSNKRIYVDPHPSNPIEQYKNVFVVKLNEKEALHFTGKTCVEDAAKDLIIKTGAEHIYITLGKDGIYYYSPFTSFYLPSRAICPKNVAGAGDCVLAALVHGMERGLEPKNVASQAMQLVADYLK